MTPTTLDRPRAGRVPLPAFADIRRRDLVKAGGLLVALSAAGCGRDVGERAGAATAAPTRRIRHDMGIAEIPAEPRRVVVVDPFTTLHTTLLLDMPVVGAMTFGPGQPPFAPFLGKDETAGIESIGYPEVNLETVAALRPDLIIGSKGFLEDTYAQLKQVAPTVVIDYLPQVEWKSDERQLGKVFDNPRRVEKALTVYEDRIAEFTSAMGSRLEDTEVSFVRFTGDEIRVHTRFHFGGAVMEEAGIRRPASQRTDDPEEIFFSLSQERISDLDADVILYVAGGGSTDQRVVADALKTYEDDPLWHRLRAVRNGRVHAVDPTHWLIGGVRAADHALTDLFRHVAERE